MPTCWIIAGPNGSGKTTFALSYLPTIAGCRNFINADLIAAGLSPLEPENNLLAASRIFLQEINAHIAAGENFSFETTLSGRSYLRLIDRLKKQGWRVQLIYLTLPNVETSKMRVAERVAHGGHKIPIADIERRFSRSLSNLLTLFSYHVDYCVCFMNDGNEPKLVFEQQNNNRQIVDAECFQTMINGAKQ